MVSTKVLLTSRRKEIIKILIKSTPTNPITLFAISQKINISERTILRELAHIEKWFLENDFKLERKVGSGFIINEDTEMKNFIKSLLDSENTKSFSRQERRRLILLEILLKNEPIKSFYFVCEFKISEGTLNSDLDFLQNYAIQYDIEIVRKSGKGIYAVGSELNYRQIIISLSYDFLDEKEILKFLMGKAEPIYKINILNKEKMFNLLDEKIIKATEKAILKAKQTINIEYSDSAYIGLIIHICICIKRIKNGHNIYINSNQLKELLKLKEYKIANEILANISDLLNIKIADDEIAFIIMYIVGARIWEKNKKEELDIKDINIRKTVIKMIQIVEEETGVYLRANKLLIDDLVSHIGIVISRLIMNIKIKNSSYKMVQKNYVEIYEVTKKACEVLKSLTNVQNIPDDEVASIAMYFCGVIYAEQKIYVAIVCTNGLGTSRMLASDLIREFSIIEVVDVVSAININVNKIFEDGIDLIVSTVKLGEEENVICVNPILLEEDKIIIRKAISQIKNTKFLTRKTPNLNKSISIEDIKESVFIGSEIINILDNIKLKELQNIDSINKLFEIASSMFSNDKEIIKSIESSFRKREEIASTYISDLQMMLLHCNNIHINNCCFGYIRLRELFEQDNISIYGVIVMIIPAENNKIHTQIMSEISRAIIEDINMLNSIKYGTIQDIRNITLKNLGNFYKQNLLN